MKILVCGSAGFIGQHVCRFFSKQHEVHGVDKPYSGSLMDFVADHQFDVLVNCAGSAVVADSFIYPVRDFEGNVGLVQELLEILRSKSPKTHFVNISSAAVYGNPSITPISEEAPCKPLSPYGYHKWMADKLCEEYSDLFNIKVSVLRVFSAYGPGLKKQLFWDTHQKMASGNILSAWGTGDESRDFIFIDDLVEAIDCVVGNQHNRFDLYNLGSGTEISVRLAIETMAKLYEWKGAISFEGSQHVGYPTRWQADISKIQGMGFQPKVAFTEGLLKYVKWAKEIL